MKYYYGEFDGEEFPTQENLFGFDQLMDFIMQYGDQAMKALEQMMKNPKNQEQSDLLKQMLKEGMLDKDGKGKLKLTPRSTGQDAAHKALMEVFANLRNGQRDGHEKITAGANGERIDGTKPYQFGDPVSELDLHQTLHNALVRARAAQPRHGGVCHLGPALVEKSSSSESPISSCTCTKGRPAAHRGAAGHERVDDAVRPVPVGQKSGDGDAGADRGPSSRRIRSTSSASIPARPRSPRSPFPLAMPKPVTIYDYQVRLKVPIDKIDQGPAALHESAHGPADGPANPAANGPSENKQLFIITDGQPTAHVEGDFVHLLYPPDPKSTVATLKEAVLAAKEGCRISTFALIEDYYGMEWVGFVDQLTKLTKGVAFYTSSGELSNCIMESYLSGRKKKSHVA